MAGKLFVLDKLNMKLDLKLLLYFYKRYILTEMKNVCEAYLEELNDKTLLKFPPLRFLLQLDVMDLLDLFPDVGEFLIREPLKWQRCCNDILYACLKSLDNHKTQNIQSTQVGVIIRLTTLPQLLTSKKQLQYQNIISLRGLLIDISKPTSYVYHTVWSCPEECEGNEVIMQFIPKIPPKCYLCKSTLFENSGFRRCGDQIGATFIFKNNVVSRTFTIIDDLIPKLQLGRMYCLNAVMLNKLTAVWSLEEHVPLPAPITSPVPTDVKKLYDVCQGMSWKFIYCLASSIGITICPLDCFMNIKISLLLSLVSVKANVVSGSAILNFLAGGYDTCYVGRLMTEAATLADSYTFLGTSHNSISTTLLGASGGVCVMPLPLQAYSQNQIHSVLSVIETGEISHEDNKAKLRCAVWAQGMDFKKIVLYNIGSIFGSVCRGDYGEYTNELVDFSLEQAMDPTHTTKEQIRALKDVATYIDLVASIKVSLDEETEILLRSYFLTARKKRPKAVTIGNLGALIATCATSARLCRRQVTSRDDAIFAIWIHVSGMPEPRFAPEEYLQTPGSINKLEKIMKNFIGWLEQFISSNVYDTA